MSSLGTIFGHVRIFGGGSQQFGRREFHLVQIPVREPTLDNNVLNLNRFDAVKTLFDTIETESDKIRTE